MKKLLLIVPVIALVAAGCNPVQPISTQTTVTEQNPASLAETQVLEPTQMPAPNPITAPSPTPSMNVRLLATVNNSGSTNTSPYAIKIYTDGSSAVLIANNPEQDYKAGTINISMLQALLQTIPDVSQIQGRCMKSVSFGTVTRITYNGKTSGDISCTFTGPGSNLYKAVGQIEAQLKIGAVMRFRPIGLSS